MKKNMTIDKLNGIEPVKNVRTVHKVQKPEKLELSDTIQVSAEAQKFAEVHFALEAVKKVPDVREDKIAEVTKKLEDPVYMDEALLNNVADKILDEYGF